MDAPKRSNQRGSTLVETAIAVAVVATVAGAALSAVIVAAHAAGADPVRDALQSEVRREMPVALDVLKYQGTSIVPTVIATTLPLPTGLPLAARVSIAAWSLPRDTLRVTITAATVDPPRESEALTTTLVERAPAPGTVVHAPGLVPAPTGAP